MKSLAIIQSVLDWTEQNLTAEITLDDLCRQAGYSPAHFCRLFQTAVGIPPMQYVTRRRLLHAIYEMPEKNGKTAIALRYGFDTYAGFYKAFQREFHCAPSAFIQNSKKDKPYRINVLQEEHMMTSRKKIRQILRNWNRETDEILPVIRPNTGRINENAYFIGQDAVLKAVADPQIIQRQRKLSDTLQKANLPAAAVFLTAASNPYVQDGERYFFLTARLHGAPLNCAELFQNPKIAYRIGENIGKLHSALKSFEDDTLPKADFYADLLNIRGNPLLSGIGFPDDPQTFGALYEQLPKQAIHRDLNPSNMLFEDGEFCGFLDFDLAEINIRIFDVCYAATAILSEAFPEDNLPKETWFSLCQNIENGYNAVQRLTQEERKAIPYVIVSLIAICIAHFSRFDKYAELAEINRAMLTWLRQNDAFLLGTRFPETSSDAVEKG